MKKKNFFDFKSVWNVTVKQNDKMLMASWKILDIIKKSGVKKEHYMQLLVEITTNLMIDFEKDYDIPLEKQQQKMAKYWTQAKKEYLEQKARWEIEDAMQEERQKKLKAKITENKRAETIKKIEINRIIIGMKRDE